MSKTMINTNRAVLVNYASNTNENQVTSSGAADIYVPLISLGVEYIYLRCFKLVEKSKFIPQYPPPIGPSFTNDELNIQAQ